MANSNWLVFKYYSRRDYDFCLQLIERQMEITYDREFLFYIKGLILREKGDFHTALKCLQKTIDYNPHNPDNYKEIGKTLYKMGRFRQSLEIFLKAESVQARPDHEVYHFIAELFYMNLGSNPKTSLAESKEYYKRAIMNGKQISSYQKLSEIYRKEKDYPKAIELLESSLQAAPDSTEIYTELGIMYLKINEVQRAQENLKEAIKIDDTSSKSLLALGAILQSKSEIDGALNHYKRIPNIQTECSEIWSNVGMCFFKKNKLIAAISCLKKALWLAPLNFNILYNLGVVYMAAHQFASAFQSLISAAGLRHENAECYMLLGICLQYLNDVDNSQVAFKKSIMLPNAIKNPLIYLNYSIFCNEFLHDSMQMHQYLNNFYNLSESIKVPSEYKLIADKLSIKLSTMPLPETLLISQPEVEQLERMHQELTIDQNEQDDESDGDLV